MLKLFLTVTGSPEILGGRVKTLHPRIHGGILARGEEDDDDLSTNGIERFDLVVCNLYPFRETLADESASEIEIINPCTCNPPDQVLRCCGKDMTPTVGRDIHLGVE